MLERLLDYWYAVEFFQPVYPINAKEDCDLRKNRLPWPPEKSDPKARISYDIYFGHSLVSDCVEWLAGKLSLPVDESLAERSQTSVCLCALKVDENGVYISDSFAVSGFAWALGRLAAAKRFTARIDYIELENLNKKINDDFCEKAAPFTLNELLVVINTVRAKTCIEDGLFTPTLWARKKIQYQKKDGSFPPLNPATELMQSFYIRDIDDIRKNPKYQVENFAESLCGDPPERTLIDSDIVSMRKWLSARYFPKGVWPSEYSPNLMQQLAINLAISGHGIFSVNGPPGTGKTTLLREILACNIVKRASIFAKYKEPDDAFEKMEFANPPDIYSCTYYRPRDDELTEFGVLIATNNNKAAENISTALPAAVTADRTGKFTNLAGIHETYFADVASELLGKPAWGLVSARLGKKENINELKERLWWAGDGITLKRYFLQPDTDWESARRNFIDAMKAVDDERAHIAKAQDLLAQFGAIIENEKRETGATRRCRAEMIDLHRKYKKTQTDSTNLEKELLNLNEGIGLLENSLSWLKRNLTGIFKKDPAVIELSRLKQEREATAMSITRLNAEKRAQNENYEKAKEALRLQEETLNNAVKARISAETCIKLLRKRFGGNFADDGFWADICFNLNSQSACPWTHKLYDVLREELFYRALMLQKAFVLGSNGVKQNLNRLFDMWDGRFGAEDRKTAYGTLVNTLFFVIPAISTTFASARTFLDGVAPGKLGVMIVDEAGQATPQSVLGALWRTRKAIIVGDPLQVEPILTTPPILCKWFADEYGLPAVYKAPDLSVQTLADAQNPYGGYREAGGAQLWLGCPLIIHRRCIEPMFGISNRLAYNERMFCRTDPPSPGKLFMLGKSAWFDIAGIETGNKDHTVKEQIILAERLFNDFIVQSGRLPDVYFITPFISVKRSIEKALRHTLRACMPEMDENNIDFWIGERCGTIHTFQGKETDEVLLVMGCDNQKGLGAARWVGQKPNIMNVAVSRARYRIGVIGDYKLWITIPYVNLLCELLG